MINIRKTLLTALLALATSPVVAEPQRVVSIGGALTEIVYALGAQQTLVGSDTTSYYPAPAEQLPKVGYMRMLSAEGILSLEPELVLMTEEAGPPAVIEQLRAAGVELLQLPPGRSLADIEHSIVSIGAALQRQRQADSLIEQLRAQNQQLVELTAAVDNQRPRVMFIMNIGGGAPMVAGTNTAANSIIALSGADNIVEGYSGYKPLSPEAAVALRPDVILTTERVIASGGTDNLLENPAVALTPAGQRGHVIAMDALLLLGFGPRTLSAALQLHQAYLDL